MKKATQRRRTLRRKTRRRYQKGGNDNNTNPFQDLQTNLFRNNTNVNNTGVNNVYTNYNTKSNSNISLGRYSTNYSSSSKSSNGFSRDYGDRFLRGMAPNWLVHGQLRDRRSRRLREQGRRMGLSRRNNASTVTQGSTYEESNNNNGYAPNIENE